MEKNLQDRVAIVIGSTSGIGKGIAIELAAHGAKVIVTGRREDRGNQVVEEIASAGNTAYFRKLDVTNPDMCQAVIDEIAATFGGIDILVNNAGVAQAATMEQLTLELWDAHYNTNIRSHFVVTKAALPYLLQSKCGNILFTSSMAAIKPFDQQFAYGSTKAAVAHFMRMLAISYAPQGLRVNAIAPGVIDTEILAGAPDGYIDAIVAGIPMHRLGQPKDIAQLAAFIVSDEASYITGQQIACCGGSSLT